MNKILPYLAIVFAMLCWAGAGIAVKEALIVFTPLTLIVMRFTLAVLLMLFIGICFAKNKELSLQRLEKKHIPLFILGGLFQPFLYFIFETYTYQCFDSPTIAEAMLSTQPILAPIFALILLRENVTRHNLIGILISTLGMLMLLLVGTGDFSIGTPWGTLLAMLTVSMSVGYTIILRKIPTRYSSLSIVFYVQSFALILFYIVWGCIDARECVNLLYSTTQQCNAIPLEQTIKSLFSVGYLALFASVTAFILFCYTVRKIGVTRANVFNNVRPIFTAVLMWLIFDEKLPISKWIGIIIIIIGLFISQKTRK